MLAHLLESRPRRSRRPATFALSVATHAAAIAVVLTGTSVAGPAPAPDETTIPQLLAPPAPRAPAPAPRGGTTATGPASPGPRMNLTTIEIEPGIPPVDLNALPTPDDFAPGAGGVGEALGTFHGASETIGDGILTLDQVEKPVLALPGAVPRYPEPLRAAGVEGRVVARFVVDTAGRVEPGSFLALDSTHERFTASVRAALAGMRFAPAEVRGRRVRQLVQQTFEFAIGR